MKLLNNKTLLVLLVLISGYGYIISCTHDNEIAPPPAVANAKFSPGTGIFLPARYCGPRSLGQHAGHTASTGDDRWRESA